MWHVTCDMWYVTCDTWHVWWAEHSLKISARYLLLFLIYDIMKIRRKRLIDWINKSINHKTINRTAPATPGLLTTRFSYCTLLLENVVSMPPQNPLLTIFLKSIFFTLRKKSPFQMTYTIGRVGPRQFLSLDLGCQLILGTRLFSTEWPTYYALILQGHISTHFSEENFKQTRAKPGAALQTPMWLINPLINWICHPLVKIYLRRCHAQTAKNCVSSQNTNYFDIFQRF